jgi:hypothetical protein
LGTMRNFKNQLNSKMVLLYLNAASCGDTVGAINTGSKFSKLNSNENFNT